MQSEKVGTLTKRTEKYNIVLHFPHEQRLFPVFFHAVHLLYLINLEFLFLDLLGQIFKKSFLCTVSHKFF